MALPVSFNSFPEATDNFPTFVDPAVNVPSVAVVAMALPVSFNSFPEATDNFPTFVDPYRGPHVAVVGENPGRGGRFLTRSEPEDRLFRVVPIGLFGVAGLFAHSYMNSAHCYRARKLDIMTRTSAMGAEASRAT